MSTTPPSDAAAPLPSVIAEVRYSLPEMLREIEAERVAGLFAREKLDQVEIGKLFKSKTAPRRVKPKK